MYFVIFGDRFVLFYCASFWAFQGSCVASVSSPGGNVRELMSPYAAGGGGSLIDNRFLGFFLLCVLLLLLFVPLTTSKSMSSVCLYKIAIAAIIARKDAGDGRASDDETVLGLGMTSKRFSWYFIIIVVLFGGSPLAGVSLQCYAQVNFGKSS